MENILNITQKPQIDESIERYEYHSYESITGTDLNRPGEFELTLKRRTCSHIRVKVIWSSTESWWKTPTTLLMPMLTSSR